MGALVSYSIQVGGTGGCDHEVKFVWVKISNEVLWRELSDAVWQFKKVLTLIDTHVLITAIR